MEPVDARGTRGDRALERVGGRLVGPHAVESGGEQPLGRGDGARRARVHQHEAARAVGDLGLACLGLGVGLGLGLGLGLGFRVSGEGQA